MPTGETTLNLLGLSTQVIAHWTYRSDGPYREHEIGNVHIQFKHTANENISGVSARSALVIQALLSLGSSVGSDKCMLSRISSDSEKKCFWESHNILQLGFLKQYN